MYMARSMPPASWSRHFARSGRPAGRHGSPGQRIGADLPEVLIGDRVARRVELVEPSAASSELWAERIDGEPAAGAELPEVVFQRARVRILPVELMLGGERKIKRKLQRKRRSRHGRIGAQPVQVVTVALEPVEAHQLVRAGPPSSGQFALRTSLRPNLAEHLPSPRASCPC